MQTSRRQLETVIIPRLNKIAELQDELRECVSPNDIRAASQRLWLLRQRQADLEHRLEARYVMKQDRLRDPAFFCTLIN